MLHLEKIDRPERLQNKAALGIKFLSAPFLSIVGVFCIVQAILIQGFSNYGYGFQYVLCSVVCANIYIYFHTWRWIQIGKSRKLDHLSLVHGYALFTGLVYALPLALASSYAMLAAVNGDISEGFIENNRAIVTWVYGLDILGNRPQLNLLEARSVVNVHYLTLSLWVAVLSVAMSLPIIWVKALAWSDHFEARPEVFHTLRKSMIFVIFLTMCFYFLYSYKTRFLYGFSVLPSGLFESTFRPSSWQRQVGWWCIVSFLYPYFLSGLLGLLISFFKKRMK